MNLSATHKRLDRLAIAKGRTRFIVVNEGDPLPDVTGDRTRVFVLTFVSPTGYAHG